MINPVLAGRIFGIAFACGLNLYATVALLGLAVRNEWIVDLPAGLGGLGHGIVIGSALALYAVELVVDRMRFVGTTWEAVHTLIRPAAAGGLALLALQDVALPLQLAAALTAAAMALLAHGSKAGFRLILATRARPRRALRTAISIVEDILAVALAAAALLHPNAALIALAASGVLLVFAGPRLWRAAVLGVRAAVARLRGFFGRPGWRSRDQLPRSLRAVIPVEPLGRSPARAAPAAITGHGGIGSYRNGWLVLTCDGPRFVYRALFRPRFRELSDITGVTLRIGLVTDALYISAASGAAFTIFLLKDGPSPHHAMAELAGRAR
ncbi:MAG: DUF4126 domain-containing protein [Gemmatimonadota bacterium]